MRPGRTASLSGQGASWDTPGEGFPRGERSAHTGVVYVGGRGGKGELVKRTEMGWGMGDGGEDGTRSLCKSSVAAATVG